MRDAPPAARRMRSICARRRRAGAVMTTAARARRAASPAQPPASACRLGARLREQRRSGEALGPGRCTGGALGSVQRPSSTAHAWRGRQRGGGAAHVRQRAGPARELHDLLRDRLVVQHRGRARARHAQAHHVPVAQRQLRAPPHASMAGALCRLVLPEDKRINAWRHAWRSLSTPSHWGLAPRGSAQSAVHLRISLPIVIPEGECLHEVHRDPLHNESACNTANRARPHQELPAPTLRMALPGHRQTNSVAAAPAPACRCRPRQSIGRPRPRASAAAAAPAGTRRRRRRRAGRAARR